MCQCSGCDEMSCGLADCDECDADKELKMAKEWTDDEVQALIKESVEIVKQDREREHYTRLHEKYGNTDPPKEPGEGDPPPPKEPAEPQVKKSLWWGDRT